MKGERSTDDLIALRERANEARQAVENGAVNAAFLDCEEALVAGLKEVQLTDGDRLMALTSQLQVIDAVKSQILSYIEQYSAAADMADEQGE